MSSSGCMREKGRRESEMLGGERMIEMVNRACCRGRDENGFMWLHRARRERPYSFVEYSAELGTVRDHEKERTIERGKGRKKEPES